MTRILSELLGSPEQLFRQKLAKLEQLSGHPNADIRLTADVTRAAKVKVHQLGLDPHDTTGQELYAALEQRLIRDDGILDAALREISHVDDAVAAVAHTLRTVPIPRSCFGMKSTTAKRLLKAVPPKRTMKQLGYRSLDSMLKHETAYALFAAGWLIESDNWRKSMLDQYRRLKSSDFESREVVIVSPSADRWQRLSNLVVAEKRHNVVALRELGALVLLPLPAERPDAITMTTLLLGLQSINEIRAVSTYLKLCQVKANFGETVRTVAIRRPAVDAILPDEPLQWEIVQRYYARFKEAFRSEIFEPHIQPEDLSWHSIEMVLEHLDARLGFWRGTQHLSFLVDHNPVSFNVIDAAVSCCNRLNYTERIVSNARASLWHELLLKYLKHDNVEQSVLGQLQLQLVTEPAVA